MKEKFVCRNCGHLQLEKYRLSLDEVDCNKCGGRSIRTFEIVREKGDF